MIHNNIVIIDCLRTPIGKINGARSAFQAPELGIPLIQELINRYPIVRDKTEHIILGNSVSAGVGQNPARKTALMGGINPEADAFTVNQVCGSGMSVVGLSRALMVDQGARLAIAGAVESCSNMPFLVDRKKHNTGAVHTPVDSLFQDGLNCAIEDIPMGEIAEEYAAFHFISRQEQDEFAFESHMRAADARRNGFFKEEIVSMGMNGQSDIPEDENIRENTGLNKLGRLLPVFKEGGTVTAGNSSGLGDCASLALLGDYDFARANGLKPKIRFVDTCVLGTPVKSVFSGAPRLLDKLLKRNNLTLGQIDVFEICESFACTVLGFLKETGIPRGKINHYGGDIALGHPMGASGARLLTTLYHTLLREEKHRGVALMSIGGGHSIGVLLETIV